MILGLIAGRWLRKSAALIPVRRLLIAGSAGIAFEVLLHLTGLCPIVKRIWTPSWTAFSGGACFLIHLDPNPFTSLGKETEPLPVGAAILLTCWRMPLWMHRRKLVLNI